MEYDGWVITDDPYLLHTETIDYEADLGAEKLIAATDGKIKILVEIKSFLRQSKTYEMHTALGQFNTYFFALQKQEPDRILYLAIPTEIYRDFVTQSFIEELLQHYDV